MANHVWSLAWQASKWPHDRSCVNVNSDGNSCTQSIAWQADGGYLTVPSATVCPGALEWACQEAPSAASSQELISEHNDVQKGLVVKVRAKAARSHLTEPSATTCPGAVGIGMPRSSLSSFLAACARSSWSAAVPCPGPLVKASTGLACACEPAVWVASAPEGVTVANRRCPRSLNSSCEIHTGRMRSNQVASSREGMDG